MSTNNHTPITSGDPANASTFNTPLGSLDAAIGSLASLPTTAKSSLVAALSELNTKEGALASLTTKDKTSIVNAITEAASRRNMQFHCRGDVTWSSTTKIMSFSNTAYVFYGTGSGATFLQVPGPFTIDFSAIAGSSYGFAYLTGITPGTSQTRTGGQIVVGDYAALASTLMRDDVVILAFFSNNIKIHAWTPFLADDLSDAWFSKKFPTLAKTNFAYQVRGSVTWDSSTKIMNFSGYTFVFYGDKGQHYARVVGPFTIDFSSVPSSSYGYAYIKVPNFESNYLATEANVVMETWDALSENMLDHNVIVLAFFENYTKVRIWTPFVLDDISHDYINGKFTRREPWVNHYPQIAGKMAGFVQKMLAPTSSPKVVLWGDSLFARENYTSAGSIDPTATPPTLVTKNIAWYLWQNIRMNKGIYRRFDYTGYFTEAGSWATSDNDANWDDASDRPGTTRLSAPVSGAAGSFAWTLGTSDDESGCNLIYRTDTAGDAAALITVAQGNGYLQVYTSSWVEANGATFSMKETDEGARRGNTIYNKQLYFKKVTPHQNDAATITISRATADTDRLLYWGVELYDQKNNKYFMKIVNSARGGHTFDQGTNKLYDYMDDDVIDQTPGLVILEIPLLNMIAAAGATKAIIVNSVQDMLWGDRVGFTNTWNLKTQSSDWANFQVICVIPHYSNAHFNVDGTFKEVFTDVTAREIYNAVKALIISKGDLGLIDLSSVMLREIDADPLYNGQYYTATAASSAAGDTYLNDGTHLNDLGTEVWARHMCPALDINTY